MHAFKHPLTLERRKQWNEWNGAAIFARGPAATTAAFAQCAVCFAIILEAQSRQLVPSRQCIIGEIVSRAKRIQHSETRFHNFVGLGILVDETPDPHRAREGWIDRPARTESKTSYLSLSTYYTENQV